MWVSKWTPRTDIPACDRGETWRNALHFEGCELSHSQAPIVDPTVGIVQIQQFRCINPKAEWRKWRKDTTLSYIMASAKPPLCD